MQLIEVMAVIRGVTEAQTEQRDALLIAFV